MLPIFNIIRSIIIVMITLFNKSFDLQFIKVLAELRPELGLRSVEDLKTNLYHDLRVIRDRSSKRGLNNYLILNYRMFSNTEEVTKTTLHQNRIEDESGLIE